MNLNIGKDSSESDLKKKNLFMNKDLSDIIIKVEGKEFYCHKEILSASSKFFRDMFQSIFPQEFSWIIYGKGGMKESFEKEITISDVKALSFEGL